jgi:4-hydroxy-tetrahydrodipicolinate synthase
LITAMATPFDQDGKLNIKGAVALAQKLVQEGTTALVLAGTTGESPTLTDEEKLELFVSVKEAVPVPIIANVGTNNTEKSAALAEKAKKAGMDGVMAVVPYYNKPSRAGLVAHFEAIAQAAQLPVMVYNVPGRTGSNMDADTILRVADIPGIAALKEATGEFDKISYVLREAPQSFSVYTGEDALTLPVLAIGAYGVVSVAAHVAGKQMRAMIDHYIAGRVEEARKLHLALTPIYKSLFVTTNPIPLKAALKLTGFDAGPLRLPLVEADEAVVALLRKDLEELGKTEGTV